ncbi:hypothetical protein KJ359_011819 [Pestalotiopsis sp. 9143b]|nr:hypothetical protein KJ359_011819 [Pestalotiopsis sp. 9143b]
MATSEQEEIARLRAINEELESDLLETQDQLLSLTEKENGVPEKAVKDAYLAVIRGVNFWIDDVSGHKDFRFRSKWQEHLQSKSRKETLEDLGLDARCHDITWQKRLGDKPSAHYTFLSIVVVNAIRDSIFHRSRTSSTRGAMYPFSMDDKSIKLVDELQQAMGSEELGRDENQILRWRGETISAMNSQRKSRERLQHEIEKTSQDLAKDLEEWLDHRVLQDHKRSLLQYVVDPAVEFARLAGCARKKYILEGENFVPGPVPDGSSWNIRNVSNWRQIAPLDARGVFHCLWPMLVRKGTGGQPDNQLVQPTMIGFLDTDLDLPEMMQSDRGS